MSRARSLLVATSVAAALAVTVSGCGGASTGTAQPAATTPAAATASAIPPAAITAEPAPALAAVTTAATPTLAVLRRIGLTAADLPKGYTGGVMPQGDVVTGQVTLDMCGATFHSEALRKARHQSAFGSPDPSTNGVSSEVVAYRAGGAAQALAEVRHAVAHCPTGVIRSGVVGVPPTKQRVTVVPTGTGLPKASIAFMFVATEPTSGRSFAQEVVFVVRGPVLAAVYVDGKSAAAQAKAHRYAVLLSTRMTKLVKLA